jgi:hypothetical protein
MDMNLKEMWSFQPSTIVKHNKPYCADDAQKEWRCSWECPFQQICVAVLGTVFLTVVHGGKAGGVYQIRLYYKKIIIK